MSFACIYIPDFLLQSAVRSEPTPRDCAIALTDGIPPLGKVVAANAAALRAGIRLGVTKARALGFSSVRVCQRSEEQEKIAHAALLDAAWSISPVVEDTAASTTVLDLNGLTHLWGSAKDTAQQILQRVSAIGLAPNIAIASNIEVAIHAARGFPGITIIPSGEEFRRLCTLPVHVFSTTQEVLDTLERWGIPTLRALAALPVLQLSERLGPEGVLLHELASGVHERALIPAVPRTTFEEAMEVEDSIEELEPLSFLLGRLLNHLCARLEARALAIRALHLRFDLEPETTSQRLKSQYHSQISSGRYSNVLRLPVPSQNSNMLLKLLRLQIEANPPKSPIRKILLTAEPARPRTMQTGLFVGGSPDPEKLELTIARLAKLVGDSNVGSPQLLDTHAPDNFHLGPFAPRSERADRCQKRENQPGMKDACEVTQSQGFRSVRPPTPVRVEVQDGQPSRVWLRGTQGKVIASSGPWRISGGWLENPWHQDEWDLAIDFGNSAKLPEPSPNSSLRHGIYRIFYDAPRGSWFLRGFYD